MLQDLQQITERQSSENELNDPLSEEEEYGDDSNYYKKKKNGQMMIDISSDLAQDSPVKEKVRLISMLSPNFS